MFTRACEYIDLAKDGWQLKKTERGLVRRMDLAGTIDEDYSTSLHQVIRTRGRLKNQDRHAGRCYREDFECDGKHGSFHALRGECRWPFNVALSVLAEAATAPFIYAPAQVVGAPKRGSAWQ
jgi:hypothetical protein